MDTKQFCYWLQGYFEISNSNSLTENQIKEIKSKLSSVFDKKTPKFGEPLTPIYGTLEQNSFGFGEAIQIAPQSTWTAISC